MSCLLYRPAVQGEAHQGRTCDGFVRLSQFDHAHSPGFLTYTVVALPVRQETDW